MTGRSRTPEERQQALDAAIARAKERNAEVKARLESCDWRDCKERSTGYDAEGQWCDAHPTAHGSEPTS